MRVFSVARKSLAWGAAVGIRPRVLQLIVDECDRPSQLGGRPPSQAVGSLAHGTRQWVDIGMVMSQRPKLLLLDEPTAGMADEEIERTAELIRDINSDASIVVVEHDMHFIRQTQLPRYSFSSRAIIVEDVMEERAAVISRVRQVYLGGSRHICLRSRTCTPATVASASLPACPFLSSRRDRRRAGTQWHGQNDFAENPGRGAGGERGRYSAMPGATSPMLELAARARAGMGYVPQGQGVFPGLTVRENLRMGGAGRDGAIAS